MRLLVTYPDSFVGRSLVQQLSQRHTVIAPAFDCLDRNECQSAVRECHPDLVVLNVPFCGGIKLNINQPAMLLRKNTCAEMNMLETALDAKVGRLVFIGSSCMYPGNAEGGQREDNILQGPLEPTNLAYSISKLVGWQACVSFSKQHGVKYQTVIPSNLYGPGDHFDEDAHVVGSLVARFHAACLANRDEIVVWGTGTPVRDFMYVDDLGDAIEFMLDRDMADATVNIGSGTGHSIREIAEELKDVSGFTGALRFDSSKPDGMKVKLLDMRILSAKGWSPRVDLREGLLRTYRWYVESHMSGKAL